MPYAAHLPQALQARAKSRSASTQSPLMLVVPGVLSRPRDRDMRLAHRSVARFVGFPDCTIEASAKHSAAGSRWGGIAVSGRCGNSLVPSGLRHCLARYAQGKPARARCGLTPRYFDEHGQQGINAHEH